MKKATHILAFFVIATAAHADWPQYLGPDRNAVAPGAGLARSWPKGGPRRLWSLPLGRGYGGASVHGGKVFVLDRIADQSDVLRCVDLDSGTEKWNYTYSAPGRHPHPGSRAVPTVDKDHVWAVGPFGHFHCISRKTHVPVWRHQLLEEFAAEEPRWGVSQSPLIYQDMVIVAPQGKKGGAAAFDKITGELRWASRPLTGVPCYTSPMRVRIDGVDQIIAMSASDRDDESLRGEMVALDPANGDVLWTYRDFNTYVNIAPPAVVGDGRLFLTNASTGGHWDPISVMLEVRRQGEGFVVEELYRTGAAAGKMQPPVMHEGYLYFNAVRNPKGMCCLSLDGKLMWDEAPDFYLGAFILVDGLILIQHGRSGDLCLVEASPDRYRELARAHLFPDITGEPWAPLALSNGKLLIRDGKQMLCVDLRNPG
ncbi:MAG: outer membrane protein assembly factor BamB family protein [Planctomycetota bacterium]